MGTMRPVLRTMIGLVAVVLSSQTLACNPLFVKRVVDDENLTSFQQQKILDENCNGNPIEGQGTVVNVYQSGNGIVVEGDFVSRYIFNLAEDNQCGDLANIRKGQHITMTGIISSAGIHGVRYEVHNSKCVN